ncbi:DUF317 domain-containing protein [Streptomyces microflavus]|uniref:DUF317 domain-containing protein n=1 Tax=Streptomyces microflavus TaxID=1919 RepID=UPI0029A4E87C|nr:DUF317 domain-containing protein [Streptomyces microflavus]MDX2403983.1 DUF317 domain-containing protein [Streptomyces microflavus]
MPPTPKTVEVDFITPRHLAGGGDPAWVTVPLHRACAWSHGKDYLRPRVLLSSPDQKALLCLEPLLDGNWWTLTHAPESGRPPWYASFGGHTPVELIAAFTDALTDPAVVNTPPDPYEPLADADWHPRYGRKGLVSPDGHAQVDRVMNRSTDHWVATTAIGNRTVWQARFGEHTPPHLITAFTTALADTRPVARPDSPHDQPTLNPDLVTRRSTEVLTVLVDSALEERVRSLTARHAIPDPAQRPARQPPSTNCRSR